MKVVLTNLARDDIDQAMFEIQSTYGERTTALFEKRFDETVAQLGRFPLSAALIDPAYPAFPDLRVMLIKRFKGRVICYRVTDTEVHVLRVLLSARDLDAVFGS